jgi:hypothetical protein
MLNSFEENQAQPAMVRESRMGISTCTQIYFPSNMILITLRHYTFQHSFRNYYNPFIRTKILFVVIKYYITVIQF